jgi:hypothetical protein
MISSSRSASYFRKKGQCEPGSTSAGPVGLPDAAIHATGDGCDNRARARPVDETNCSTRLKCERVASGCRSGLQSERRREEQHGTGDRRARVRATAVRPRFLCLLCSLRTNNFGAVCMCGVATIVLHAAVLAASRGLRRSNAAGNYQYAWAPINSTTVQGLGYVHVRITACDL